MKFTNFSEIKNYHNSSQKIRILSENWVGNNIFCPNCGENIKHYQNNKPVADFYCPKCLEDFELKSKNGKSFGKIVPDGKYKTMIERIISQNSPNFFFLNYDKSDYNIINFFAAPSYIFVPDMIIQRKKGIPNRPNYMMCNINISVIPNSGKIYYIKDGERLNKNQIIDSWHKTTFLRQTQNIDSKGWLIDIMNCIDKMEKETFSLTDMYSFENYLKIKHPENNNIKAKIRQQLQILRDRGYLKFISRGKYKLKM